MYKTTAKNLKGDSGGIAYMLFNGNYIAAGTMAASSYKGNSLTGDTFTYSYISKIVNNQLRTGAYLY